MPARTGMKRCTIRRRKIIETKREHAESKPNSGVMVVEQHTVQYR